MLANSNPISHSLCRAGPLGAHFITRRVEKNSASRFLLGGLRNPFCDRRELDLSARRSRVTAPPLSHAVSFRRQCWGQLGKTCSTRNKMPPSLSQPPVIIFRSPVITVSTVSAALERSADEVLDMVLDGRLRFAWNIARAGESRQEIRILTRSLFNYQNCIASSALNDEEDFQHAVKTIFPATAHKPDGVRFIRAAAITRRLCASRPHIYRLCNDAVFRVLPNSPRHGGPTGSPEVEFSSVVEFLRQRRIA